MFKANTTGVETDATVGVATRSAVLQIATDGAADGCQLTANLMMSACMEMNLEEMEAVRVPDNLVVEDGLLGIGTLAVIGVALVLLLVANKVMCQRCLQFFRFVLHQRPVGFLHALCAEQLIQTRQRLTGSGKNHHPTDGAV